MSSIDNSNTGENESIEALKSLIKIYQTLNSLHHQNIIRTYGIFTGDHKNPPSILMEHYPRNLKDSINELTSIQKITAIYELSIALRDIHSCDFFHCNVKPSNNN